MNHNKLTPTTTAIPYNTGKVKIGEFYTPPLRNHVSEEGEHWQGVLTGVYQSRQTHKMQITLYVVAYIVMIAAIWGLT